MQKIYFVGGCLWGVEEYFSRTPGICDTECGYADGAMENPVYEGVCSSTIGFAEIVCISYNPNIVALRILVRRLFRIIDPVSINRQGNNRGSRYRTSIYYISDEDLGPIQPVMFGIQKDYGQPLAVESEPLRDFYPAEDYHQNYLQNHPHDYYHIDFSSLKNLIVRPDGRTGIKQDWAEFQKQLTREQHGVIRNASTERPFSGPCWNYHEPGLYVDIVTGEPLFTSTYKFDSSCGWPNFIRSVISCVTTELPDSNHDTHRVKVHSREGDSHLNHVFEDDSTGTGGLCYCVNSTTLRSVPRSRMEGERYGAYLDLATQTYRLRLGNEHLQISSLDLHQKKTHRQIGRRTNEQHQVSLLYPSLLNGFTKSVGY